MKLWKKIALVSVLGFSAGFASIYLTQTFPEAASTASAEKPSGKPAELDWTILRELDLNSGKPSANLSKHNNQSVRIPGFMIPLEDNQSMVSEFLLVPSPMACVHVPPPPSNQIVHVKMAGGQKTKMSFGPIWLQGKLRIAEINGPYGKSSYEVLGELTEPFQ